MATVTYGAAAGVPEPLTISPDEAAATSPDEGVSPDEGGDRPGPQGLAALDQQGQIVFINEDLALLLGGEASELAGQDIFRFLEEEQRPAARQALRRAARTGRVAASVWKARGSGQGAQLTLQPGTLAGPGGARLYIVMAQAGPPRYRAVERQALLASIAEECDEAIVATGPAGVIEIWNNAAAELFGWAEKEVVGSPLSMVVPPERQSELCEHMSRAWAGEVLGRVETVRVCKHGSRVEVSVSFAPLRDRCGQVRGVSQVIRDITQQKASERALAFQAMHDHLTGLPNRSLLEDRMAHALERCQREGTSIAVIFFDVDHFKTVNDTAGHEVGDRLLRAVASRLRQSVRSMDTVARLGGDEFVVLCEDVKDASQVDTIVSHIMRSFSEPVVLPGRQLWVSVSAGVAMGGAPSSVAQLLSQADSAMYQAKGRARGSIGHYDPRTRPDLERRAEGSRLLRLALEAGHLVPYYQPIIDLHSGALAGAEALARWEDPLRGVVPAKDFIPLAEDLGLIGEIFEMVLAQTAKYVKQWASLSPSLRVAVNVSPLQLRGSGLGQCIKAILDQGVEPSSIVLEVTESSLLEDAAASAVLSELREDGFGIAIDDFGTGYSSLAYLKQLPATTVKVDRTFTAQLPDPHDLSVVMAILAIADTYGLEVVAEGIETPDQAEVLKELGCQHGQGYHFARPMPGPQFTELLRSRLAVARR